MSERAILRERLAAIDRAVEAIEAAFGDLGEQLVYHTATEPSVRLNEAFPHGFPPETLANDVELAPWEVFNLLRHVREAYATDVLGPAERAPTNAAVPGPIHPQGER